MDRLITSFFYLRILIGIFYVLFSFAQMAGADTLTNPGGQGPTGTTCFTQAIPATSTNVPLVAPSAYVTVVNLSGSATLYFSPTSPATTSKFPIAPNSAFSYGGVPLSNFYVIGSGTGDNFGVIAH